MTSWTINMYHGSHWHLEERLERFPKGIKGIMMVQDLRSRFQRGGNVTFVE